MIINDLLLGLEHDLAKDIYIYIFIFPLCGTGEVLQNINIAAFCAR